MSLEARIREAENGLFVGVGAKVDEFFLELAQTGGRVRVLSSGNGPPLILLHGVSLSSAVWPPLFDALAGWRLLAVDLPGHGLSDPVNYQRGEVREHARRLIDDILDALGLDEVPVVGHSLGGMFALWHLATGSGRISSLIALGEPGVALTGARVRMPLSLLTVRGLGAAVLRSPSPRPIYRRLLAEGLGSAEVAGAPESLIDVLRLSARRPENARTVASLMRAINRFRRPRAESVLTSAQLAAIPVPTIFILGSDDAYLSPQLARSSIEQIPDATLHEVAAGHAPWLVDANPKATSIRDGLSWSQLHGMPHAWRFATGPLSALTRLCGPNGIQADDWFRRPGRCRMRPTGCWSRGRSCDGLKESVVRWAYGPASAGRAPDSR